eukprot:4257650-Heterocapsa_arctica.AAC.1
MVQTHSVDRQLAVASKNCDPGRCAKMWVETFMNTYYVFCCENIASPPGEMYQILRYTPDAVFMSQPSAPSRAPK